MNRFLIGLFALFAFTFAHELDKELQMLKENEGVLNKTAEAWEKEGYKNVAKFLRDNTARYQQVSENWDKLLKDNSTGENADKERKHQMKMFKLEVYLVLNQFETLKERESLMDQIKQVVLIRYARYELNMKEYEQYSKDKEIVLKIIEQEKNKTNSKQDELYGKLQPVLYLNEAVKPDVLDGYDDYVEHLKSVNSTKAPQLEVYAKALRTYSEELKKLAPIDSKERVETLIEKTKDLIKAQKDNIIGENDEEMIDYVLDRLVKHMSNSASFNSVLSNTIFIVAAIASIVSFI